MAEGHRIALNTPRTSVSPLASTRATWWDHELNEDPHEVLSEWCLSRIVGRP